MKNGRRAFITGAAGQDGSYLAELLLGKGYQVYGLVRHSTTSNTYENINHLRSEHGFEILTGDITDRSMLERQLRLIKPHEVYNLAAQSHVGKSFEMPEQTTLVTGHAVIGLLEAIRLSGFNSRFYQASTSELFGNAAGEMQSEMTPMLPVSPYGCAKLLAHNVVRVYRVSYNMFACSGILFNHESPRRGPEFVTQKIANGVARIAHGHDRIIKLGNLKAQRDWGHARDYVEGMHMMLNRSQPEDFVLATGQTHTILEFVELAFKHVGLDYHDHVEIDPALFRPTDVHVLCGDASRARDVMGWSPRTTFNELVSDMVDMAMLKHKPSSSFKVRPEELCRG